MTGIRQRLILCGTGEIGQFQGRPVTHILSIANPGIALPLPEWFQGVRSQLWFGDVISEEDATRCRTRAPTLEDIRRGLNFLREGWCLKDTCLLLHCDQGVSRSPALAYVFVADQLGPGGEAEAFKLILRLRPNAAPNGFVVRLGDSLLRRNGALLLPLRQYNSRVFDETWP